MARVGQQEDQTAQGTYAGQSGQAYTAAQGDLTQAKTDQNNLREGKNVGANPYLNPQYLAAVNRLRSSTLNQQNNTADAQLRAENARTGGMNSTATTGTIGKLAGDKMRLGNELGAEQTAGDWTKNIGYQLNLAQQPLDAAKVQGGLYNTATGGQGDALKNLTQLGIAQYGPWMKGLDIYGQAAKAAAQGAQG